MSYPQRLLGFKMFYFKKKSPEPWKSLKIFEIIYLLFLNIPFGGHGQKYPNSADLSDALFRDANLSNAVLSVSTINNADFSKADLRGAKLTCIYSSNINFVEAKLCNADLSHSVLIDTSFRCADLSWANFERADLSNSTFIFNVVSNTIFSEANLSGAILRAKDLTFDQLSKAKTLYNARLYPELEKQLRDKHPELFEEPKGPNTS